MLEAGFLLTYILGQSYVTFENAIIAENLHFCYVV